MLSGLNLAFFSVSKLRLELEAGKNNKDALRVLHLRENSNFLLVTILWANVAVNVLLALLAGSVLAGFMAFLFSTILITIAGEIIPQAYFSRHAINLASLFSPLPDGKLFLEEYLAMKLSQVLPPFACLPSANMQCRKARAEGKQENKGLCVSKLDHQEII